jgi:hypothetical protein
MAGFSVVWNIVLAPYLLNEKLSTQDVRGSAVILLGCILVGISGSHDTPTHHSDELFALFQSRIFIEYGIIAVCTAVVVSWWKMLELKLIVGIESTDVDIFCCAAALTVGVDDMQL